MVRVKNDLSRPIKKVKDRNLVKPNNKPRLSLIKSNLLSRKPTQPRKKKKAHR